MIRRSFLAAATSAALLVALVATLSPAPSRASSTLEFQPGVLEEALASGKAVLVDYAADWCSTCARQERVLGALRGGDPAYDENIVFIRVDWDDFRRHEVATSRNIPRRSTLVLLRGEDELGRLVGDTREQKIKELLDLALTSS